MAVDAGHDPDGGEAAEFAAIRRVAAEHDGEMHLVGARLDDAALVPRGMVPAVTGARPEGVQASSTAVAAATAASCAMPRSSRPCSGRCRWVAGSGGGVPCAMADGRGRFRSGRGCLCGGGAVGAPAASPVGSRRRRLRRGRCRGIDPGGIGPCGCGRYGNDAYVSGRAPPYVPRRRPGLRTGRGSCR